ncbi:MAG: hypothetical protein AAB568_01190 [Patescibacteria group bacterium]
MKEGLNFLKQKFNLHASPEVESAVKRTEVRTKEKVPQNPADRIQNFLDRFKEVTDRTDPTDREHGLDAFKRALYIKNVVKPGDVPESAFLLEQRIARELGYGDVEITEEFKEQKTTQIINNQKQSLDKWVDYLSSEDAQYPDWAKYWALRSVLEMGKLQKEEDEQGKESAHFQKRVKDTVASFPTLNPRALALTIGVLKSKLEEKAKPKKEQKPIKNESVKLNDQEFQNLLSTENFSKIYAQFLIEMPEYSTEGLQEVRGEWVKYNRGSDAKPLVKSLEGHPLEWCTADFDTAHTQLQGGDFYVYYSFNQAGKPIIPRAAIRMQENSIAEVRGIASDQNLDPYITDVVKKKMQEFPDGEQYEKEAGDMKLLTTLENKTRVGQPLTKDDLLFLYEINSKIKGFGYDDDPRIKELRDQRDPKTDAPIVFECEPNQIAWNQKDINDKTKAYVGPLFANIFQTLKHLEHLYTSFPEGKIVKNTIEIGGKTKAELEKELKAGNFQVGSYAKSMMESKDFVTTKKMELADLIRLKVGDLGLNHPTTDQIYKKIQELGLELCPAEVGPQYRLQYTDQPLNEYLYIGMKQITGSGGRPDVFVLSRGGDGLWLDGSWAEPGARWNSVSTFVFRLRK